jgi:hypothetical protein
LNSCVYLIPIRHPFYTHSGVHFFGGSPKLTGSIYVPTPTDCAIVRMTARLRRARHDQLAAFAKLPQGVAPDSCPNE